jgi:nicotinamide riboside kinase
MTTQLKYAITGTHGTGKTTYLLKIAERMKKLSNISVGIINEFARECPFQINDEGDENTFLWLFSKQLLIETEYKNHRYDVILCDRTILDSVIYASKINVKYCKSFNTFLQEYINTYNQIIYLNNSNDYLINDGIRMIDTNYQSEIDELLIETYQNLVPEYKMVFLDNELEKEKYIYQLINDAIFTLKVKKNNEEPSIG